MVRKKPNRLTVSMRMAHMESVVIATRYGGDTGDDLKYPFDLVYCSRYFSINNQIIDSGVN